MPNHLLYTLFILFLFSINAQSAPNGFLTIMSNPLEAKVWVDNSYIGTTPIREYSIKTGTHTVRVLDPISQISRTESVKISRDSTSMLNIALEREFGGLKIITDPPGAQVVITSKIGITPLDDSRIIPGAYTLEIHPKSNHQEVITKDIIISPHTTTELTEEFSRKQELNGIQIGLRIGLGLLAGGLYYWGFDSMYHDNNSKAIAGFTSGSIALASLITISIAF